MPHSNGGIETNLIEYYSIGEDNQVDYGKNRYLAQTFTLGTEYAVWRFLTKLFTIQMGHFYHFAIRNTDGAGKPIGEDISHTTLAPTGETPHSPGKWRRFDFPGWPVLPAGQYALVLSVPTTTTWQSHKWRCDATSPTYTRGKAWLSHNQGVDWEEVPGTDFMFQIWGYATPPPPPPTPTISNWASQDIEQYPVEDGYAIVFKTDIKCHLYMRWTTVEPQIHKQSVLRRGLLMHTDLRYCFVAWEENEQIEPGDTLTHTFIKTNWPICQTRWFYFVGTVAAEQQPSVSPIFKKHRTALEYELIILEPWTT